MVKFSFIFSLLFTCQSMASGLQASFGSPNLSGLTRPTTRFETDGRIDSAGLLLDISGNGRNLSPTASPITAVSTLQRSDGNRWLGRTFNGVNTRYESAAFDGAFNISSNNHTITIIAKSNISRFILGFPASGIENIKSGFHIGSSFTVVYWKADGGSLSVNGPLDTTVDGKYHIIQVVKSANIVRFIIDGISGTPTNVTGYGIDATQGVFKIAWAGGGVFSGDILYTRLDAEALTEDRLAYEKDYLTGLAARSGTADIGWDFSRASTATSEFSDKSISYSAATNIPRVSGDGGGVLTEGQRTNILTYSQDQTNAAWSTTNITNPPVAYTSVDPLGTYSAYILAEDGTVAANHKIARSGWVTVVASTTYTYSVFIKAINRQYVSLMLWESGGSFATAVFNVSAGRIISSVGSLYDTIVPYANGWYRCSISKIVTAGITQIDTSVNIRTDTTDTFDGLTQDSLAMFGSQLEVGSFPSTYIPTVASAVIRYQDNLLMPPYKLGKDLRVPGATPKLEVDFSQNPLSATLLDNTGTYTFTKGGTVTALDDYTRNRRFVFNGTDSQYVLTDASAIFSPAGNFSVVLVARPAVLPGTFYYLFGKYTTAGDKRSWSIYNNSTGEWTFAVSQGGDSGTTSFVQKTDSVQVGRTALIVATFNCPTPPCAIASGGPGNNYEGKIYVDDTTVVTDSAFYGPAKVNDADMNIGRSGGGARFTGDLSYVALYDGTVISATQVQALYAKFKQSNVLPLGLGTSPTDPTDHYTGQKLTIEFEAKCQFTSLTDMGADRTLLSIGSLYFTGSAGTATLPAGATLTRNYIKIFAELDDGKVYADFYSATSSTRRFMSTAVISTYNQWHKYKVYYDFSDLDSSNIWVDNVAGTLDASMTNAAHTFQTTDLYIRIGQPNNALVTTNTMLGTTDSHCSMRNLRIVPERF